MEQTPTAYSSTDQTMRDGAEYKLKTACMCSSQPITARARGVIPFSLVGGLPGNKAVLSV